MNKNEIALSFEQAEYYTLQEACDYLNMKHGTNNTKPKNLLKSMIKHDTDSYVYGRGFGVQCDFDTPFVNRDFYQNNKDLVISETQELEKDLSFHSCYYGLLFKLDKEVKRKLVFKKVTYGIDLIESDLFCGVLDIENTDKNPQYPEFCYSFTNKSIRYEILALYPRFCFEYEEIDFNEILPKLKEIPTDENELPLLEISIDDVIILHKDLLILENNIINNSPASPREFQIKPRKGVSPQKILANEQAKIIAKALWNNDKEQKIKIKEMASLVYRELYDSEFKRQLPHNQDSLKDWIRDIAPPYATTGGRPKNEP